ncbi:MAG: hypothetical protein R3F44_01345 [Candidatus Competibacteraceae bacterium]
MGRQDHTPPPPHRRYQSGLVLPELSVIKADLLEEHFAALGIGLFETAKPGGHRTKSYTGWRASRAHSILEQATAAAKNIDPAHRAFHYVGIGRPIYHMAPLVPCHVPVRTRIRYAKLSCAANASVAPSCTHLHENLRDLLRAFKRERRCDRNPIRTTAFATASSCLSFGVPTCAITATSRLAALSTARRWYPTSTPLGRNIGYGADAGAGKIFSGDVASVLSTNCWSGTSAKVPAQYLWVHRRFKTQPPGNPRIYPP